MQLDITYRNSRTGEHEEYTATLADLVESFTGAVITLHDEHSLYNSLSYGIGGPDSEEQAESFRVALLGKLDAYSSATILVGHGVTTVRYQTEPHYTEDHRLHGRSLEDQQRDLAWEILHSWGCDLSDGQLDELARAFDHAIHCGDCQEIIEPGATVFHLECGQEEEVTE
jgi:hypothetical protein